VEGRLYVRPASHAGGPTGPTGSVPYGSRLRLRDDFPILGYPPPVLVILHTFQRFGIVLADGGIVALTAESDRYTTTQWSTLGIDAQIFYETPNATPVDITHFEVIDTGERIGETYECVPWVPPIHLFVAGAPAGPGSALPGPLPEPDRSGSGR
jgi:serine/threonine-protein kinase